MGQDISVLLAFVAGLASFLSPCIFPLFPSYISFIGGASLDSLKTDRVSRTKAFIHTIFFVLGFSTVFIPVSIFLRTTITFFSPVGQIINLVAGFIIIFLGINFIFDFWKLLNIEKHVNVKKEVSSGIGAFLFGMAFGAGWTPCVGPMLGSIFLMASVEQTFLQSIFLLIAFSLGLGLPFILISLFFEVAYKHYRKLLPYLPIIKTISGLILVLIGVLILTNRLAMITYVMQDFTDTLDKLPPLTVKLILGSLFSGIGLLVGFFFMRRLAKNKQDKAAGQTVKWPWVRLVFLIIFLGSGLAVFIGLLNIVQLLKFWLTFQGL